MDETLPPSPDASADAKPAAKKKRTVARKAVTKRARAPKATDNTAELPLGDSKPAPSVSEKATAAEAPVKKTIRRPRTRKTSSSEPAAEVSAPSAPKEPVPAAAPAPARKEAPAAAAHATPEASKADVAEKPERRLFKPKPVSPEERPAPAAAPTSKAPRDAEAGEQSHTSHVRSDFPDNERGTPSGDRANGNGNGGGGNGGGNSDEGDDNEPWWKKKKKNRRDKRKKGRGPGGPGGPGGGGPGGQQSSGPKYPQQPPPPEFSRIKGDLPDPARFDDMAELDAKTAEILAAPGEPLSLDFVYSRTLGELGALARELKVELEGVPSRAVLLDAIFGAVVAQGRPLVDFGWLDLTDRGYGFIVHEHVNYRLFPENSLMPDTLVTRYGLKRGHKVKVVVMPPAEGDRCPAVVGVTEVMDMPPEEIAAIVPFEELIPYYPLKRILLEAPEVHRKDVSMRAIDLLTPVGFGQRGLLVAPPRTGKTVLLKNIANSISHNFPDKKLILLLIDERPEEVTDFRRHTAGEVVSSTFDEAPENHVHCAEMVIEKARRMVEKGEHVVILLDSITRLARAYNALASNSGKIMSGGIEATAMQKPKRFFGSARNIEGGGSLTILGTALIDTGSRMDEVIFEEFKGTGNMELHLDRGLSDKRIFPAINMDRSGTRKEELIYHPEEMIRVHSLRRAMQGVPPVEAMEMFLTRLRKTGTNAEFLMSLNRQ